MSCKTCIYVPNEVPRSLNLFLSWTCLRFLCPLKPLKRLSPTPSLLYYLPFLRLESSIMVCLGSPPRLFLFCKPVIIYPKTSRLEIPTREELAKSQSRSSTIPPKSPSSCRVWGKKAARWISFPSCSMGKKNLHPPVCKSQPRSAQSTAQLITSNYTQRVRALRTPVLCTE